MVAGDGDEPWLEARVRQVGWALVWPNAELWALEPSARQLVWFNVFYNGILAMLGLIGPIWILREWRVYGRRTTRERG